LNSSKNIVLLEIEETEIAIANYECAIGECLKSERASCSLLACCSGIGWHLEFVLPENNRLLGFVSQFADRVYRSGLSSSEVAEVSHDT
jgi:hypothetical protein